MTGQQPTRPFAKVAEVHVGTKLTTDGGFPCMAAGVNLAVQAEVPGEFFVTCECGRHYLAGQIDGDIYTGLYLATLNPAAITDDMIAAAVQNSDLDAALQPMMIAAGISDGGMAGVCFSGAVDNDDPSENWENLSPETRTGLIREWIAAETPDDAALSFEQWQATRKAATQTELAEVACVEADDMSKAGGFLYAGACWIETLDDGSYSALIANTQFVDVDLEKVERHLFDNWYRDGEA